ncbi:MAG: cache domain-containing protein, partial [Bacteroidales bacterium]|nr:cache domain-containing protein [Bacteroidales bacterium]
AMVMGGRTAWMIYTEQMPVFRKNGYVHFVNRLEEDDIILISRPRMHVSGFLVAAVFLGLLLFLVFSLPLLGHRRPRPFEKNYYRSQVMVVLIVSLVVTLVTMALVSVYFVYERNEANLRSVMSSKISSLQETVETRFRYVQGPSELNSADVDAALEDWSELAGMDITLYTPDGRAFLSTAPEMFERMLIGRRMDGEAFESIVYQHRRYYIHREKIGAHAYYAMYAPVFNLDGRMVAILSCPYTPDSYTFSQDAILHSSTIIAVFIILLILARLMTSAVVDRMFGPLVEMGRKMNATSVDNLEYIEYDRDDEISTLVQSYNRMVSDLSESTRQLAQAERDKAWSAMARQVAHEIKNPLTPMKLQLQRIIRLKAKGDSRWQENFDEMARVILDHIDMLSDTANEFSTFAKLYSEEPTSIRLDLLIEEELAMFGNRDNIEFTFLGMGPVTVMGPKPQLTRVFVNLIANAVQAVEGALSAAETGSETGASAGRRGQVMVSLRKATEEGYYDIVFEDNGPGVSEENQDKLFTPNFTTKTGGTGLGLAISRSILERCGAAISYSRSFTLGGACFTIKYPAA